jgi:hypothetical protein
MKKYTILFALLVGTILFAIEAAPQNHVLSLSEGCQDPNGKKIPCPPSGNNDTPGPKNKKPTPVDTIVPTSTPTSIPILQPTPYPYPYPYPPHKPKPTPVSGGITSNACVLYLCWNPILVLAGGGVSIFLIIVAFVFFRGGIIPPGGPGDPPPGPEQ